MKDDETMEPPKSYTSRELWMLIKNNNDTNLLQHKIIQESIDEFHRATRSTLEEISKQTKKTNGSVMDLLLWRMYVKGQTWIIPLLVGGIVSIIVSIILSFIKIGGVAL